jgi:cysteinyl-tRNA synthetase
MSKIQVFNTLSGKKEDFLPIAGNKVKMYACGPTVYALSHLGHARMTIVWDVVQRYLRFSGYDVTYVRNITDVDDKIINRAAELGVSPERLAREYTYAFWHDMHLLNVESPDYEPRATEYINQMIAFVEGLIEAKHAYEAGGDVYFDVASFKEYGKLGKQNLEQLLVGAREQVVAQESLQKLKKSPVDFALWKSAKPEEMGWPSPWGRGRPGWHLECSCMVKRILGETIDIHAGGEDLVFPHHENEIAQSEALHGRPLANYWMHNSFIMVDAEKMAKSLGNFKTIQDIMAAFSADTIRIFILQTHYRNPIDFSIDGLQAVKNGLQKLIKAAAENHVSNNQGENQSTNNQSENQAEPSQEAQVIAEKFKQEFCDAMNNDFNTAVAISQLFHIADQISLSKNSADRQYLASTMVSYAQVLGLTLKDTRKEIDSDAAGKLVDLILQLRSDARGRKDYASSDLIRKSLTDIGINVMDSAAGVHWEKV